MDRRKFIIGMGALSAGGAAALGSGAFSRIEAQRGVMIQVVEDPDAYLGLDACDTLHGDNYVELDGKGHLRIDIGENPNDGQGVNSNSQTWFDGVFQVCNQGKEHICLWIDDTDWPVVDEGPFEGEPRVDFYFGDDREASLLGPGNATLLELGACTCIGIKTNTHGIDATEEDTLLDALDDEILIIADVSAPDTTDPSTSSNGVVGLQNTPNDTGGSFDEVYDMSDPGIDEGSLADTLTAVDGGISILNVEYIGHEEAAGVFEGTPNIMGFDDGIILSSGRVKDVVGPNESASTSTSFGTPGDDDLSDLIGGTSTNDAAILEIEFEVAEGEEAIFFNYVFGSEEYNEYVGEFNDVFAFFLDGENLATVDDPDNGELPAAINHINHGYVPNDEDPTNPELYVNNDPFHGDGVAVDPEDPPGPGVGWDPSTEDAPYDTEMDGFTTVLQVQGEVDPDETHELRIGIADAIDAVWDSWVLLEGGTFDVDPPDDNDEPDPDPC